MKNYKKLKSRKSCVMSYVLCLRFFAVQFWRKIPLKSYFLAKNPIEILLFGEKCHCNLTFFIFRSHECHLNLTFSICRSRECYLNLTFFISRTHECALNLNFFIVRSHECAFDLTCVSYNLCSACRNFSACRS